MIIANLILTVIYIVIIADTFFRVKKYKEDIRHYQQSFQTALKMLNESDIVMSPDFNSFKDFLLKKIEHQDDLYRNLDVRLNQLKVEGYKNVNVTIVRGK